MSECFIVRRGGGGGIANAFAAIAVTYFEGSICTCTKGSKVLTAKDTSGRYLFLIPEPGVWTVTATDGAHVRSKDVTITDEWQCENIWLPFEVMLFDGSAGGDCADITGGWHRECGSGSISVSETAITVSVTPLKDTNFSVCTENQIDVTNYETLVCQARLADYRWGSPKIGLFNTTTRGDYSAAATLDWGKTEESAASTKRLDISEVSGSYYIGAKDTDPVFYIYKIWLE